MRSPPTQNHIIRLHHLPASQRPIPRRKLILCKPELLVKLQPVGVAREAREHDLFRRRDIFRNGDELGHEVLAEAGSDLQRHTDKPELATRKQAERSFEKDGTHP